MVETRNTNSAKFRCLGLFWFVLKMLNFAFSVLPCKLPRPSQTLSFYRFTKISNPQTFQERLFVGWGSLNCTGRVYVSNEGKLFEIS